MPGCLRRVLCPRRNSKTALLCKRTGGGVLSVERQKRTGAVLLPLQKRTGACCTVKAEVARQQNGASVEQLLGACSALWKPTGACSVL